MDIFNRFRNKTEMSNIVSYVYATGVITVEKGKDVTYNFTIQPKQAMTLAILHEFQVDVEDFERYLIEKYSTGNNYEKVDSFSVWKKLKRAIKNVF